MQNQIKATPSAAVAVFVALAALSPAAYAATLAEALSDYRANRVADAERQLSELAGDPSTSAQDRASAVRELGRIDGLVRGETDAIAAAMAQTPSGEEACETAVIALRIYREANQSAPPLAYAATAAPGCPPAAAETLRIETARTHLVLAVSDPAHKTGHLDAAATQLEVIEEVARGAPAVASARFTLAMLRRDATAAFAAWRDYYWLADSDAPQALSAFTGRVQSIFSAGLAPGAADVDALALASMLTRAGFTADARQYANDLNLAARNESNIEWRRLDSFFTFDASVRAITLRANREMARGGRAGWYEDEINGAIGRLMEANGLSGDPRVALREGFGIFGTLGLTGGYPSLHGGHVVQEERVGVTQYGRDGEVRFIVVDRMLSNGFESWLWDGWAEAGGWSSDGNTIVQIRSAYTDGPLNALRRTRPGPDRDRFLARLEQHAADERAALSRDRVGPAPATESRLEQQGYDQIAAQVGNDDEAFLADVWRATNQYSLESHEGRHALDNISQGRFSDAELERRAKLSQIIFADYPRLGLANVAGGVINRSPHGVANRRVLEGYRRWMRAHRDEIAGFDRNQPTLSQLDKLTDAQIVAVARSMDPWAR